MKPFKYQHRVKLSAFSIDILIGICMYNASFSTYRPVTWKNYGVVLSNFKMCFFAGIRFGVIIIEKG